MRCILLSILLSIGLGGENLFPDPQLSHPRLWSLPAGYALHPSGGRQNGPTLTYVRHDPAAYPLAAIPVSLSPGTYDFGGWVHAENLEQDNVSAAICMEISQGGRHLGGSYLPRALGPGDWRYVAGVLKVPDLPHLSVQFVPYMLRGGTGRIKFSDLFIRRQSPRLFVSMLRPQFNHHISPLDRRCELHLAAANLPKTIPPNPSLELSIREQSSNRRAACFTVTARDNRVSFTLPSLKPGSYFLTCRLLSPSTHSVLASDRIPFTMKAKPRSEAISLDRHCNLIVEGKRFLPLGVYCNRQAIKERAPSLEDELKMIKSGGFNCYLPYDGMAHRLQDTTATGLKAVRETWDMAERLGLKVIPSLDYIRRDTPQCEQIVKRMKDHRALLAWYLFDEQSCDERASMQKHNQTIRLLDPAHPTFGVSLQPDAMTQYGGTCTLYGFDQYPIYRNTDNIYGLHASLSQVGESLNTEDGAAFWFIPQWMSWSSYSNSRDRAANERLYRWPTVSETLTMCMAAAMQGAKGFIFYSYFDMFTTDRDEFSVRWAQLRSVARQMNRLSPYLLGDTQPMRMRLMQATGNVKAASFRDADHRQAVVIISLGKGPARASLRLPGSWESSRGKTRLTADGSWHFRTDEIDCDILYRDHSGSR